MRTFVVDSMTSKIIHSISYVEKLNSFTESAFTYRSRPDSKHQQLKSFGCVANLTTCLYSASNAESEKNNEVENFAHFEKDVFFFRPKGSIC